MEPDERTLEEIARSVERGEDSIDVPEEWLVEPETPRPLPESLWARVRSMSVGERIKLALRGNREARGLLLRDSNRLVRRLVLQNPRLTVDEVLALCRNRTADSELLVSVADNRDWTRNYQVRLALVQNPRTPVPLALKLLDSLWDRDVRLLAKSKNVSDAVSAKARRLVLDREKRR
ncbi:MAG: hypothetical protein KatS3mg076_0492 [Candidatus Binatia bacterium]|nr:MAG: hypothetical protein KatS3mg076_0492 [Candidatus Binatia bacterium]